jgi:hypothetical protein
MQITYNNNNNNNNNNNKSNTYRSKPTSLMRASVTTKDTMIKEN